MRGANDTLLRMSGKWFVIERDGEELVRVKGNKNRKEQTVSFGHKTDVRQGDWLIEEDPGRRFFVQDVEKPVWNSQITSVVAYYLTEDERAAKQEPAEPPTQSFIFNAPAYGVFGSQQDFTLEQVIGDLDRLISQNGGEDEEELREMVAEVRSTLENQDSISRSKFERWSELANKHAPWLLSPLGSLLVNYTFGG